MKLSKCLMVKFLTKVCMNDPYSIMRSNIVFIENSVQYEPSDTDVAIAEGIVELLDHPPEGFSRAEAADFANFLCCW